MSQRISDELARCLLRDASREAHKAGWSASSCLNLQDIGLDLIEARARIAELERLSASQAEALDLMEAGRL